MDERPLDKLDVAMALRKHFNGRLPDGEEESMVVRIFGSCEEAVAAINGRRKIKDVTTPDLLKELSNRDNYRIEVRNLKAVTTLDLIKEIERRYEDFTTNPVPAIDIFKEIVNGNFYGAEMVTEKKRKKTHEPEHKRFYLTRFKKAIDSSVDTLQSL
jgi:hypothetical protein